MKILAKKFPKRTPRRVEFAGDSRRACQISRHHDKGIALIVVMIAIFVLSLLVGEFAMSMKVETKLAMTAKHEADLEWLGRSGAEFARWVLAQQMTVQNEPYDSLNQIWAGGPGGLAESNSPLAGISLQGVPVGDGMISIKITDAERKVNINTADEPTLHQALNLIGVDGSVIPTISDSVMDWVDQDDMPRVNGAESDYYQGLNPPYFSKNGPIDDISELLMIKGVTEEVYDNSSSSNEPSSYQPQVHHLNSPIGEQVYTASLKEIFTPLSSGKININTASSTVLQMIPGVDENIAAQIIRTRSGPDGQDGTEDDTPFQNVGELASVGLPQSAAGNLSRYCTVRSAVFEVEIEASIGGTTKQFHAILGRNNPRDVQVLGFY